jgi:hypothetical protein
MKTLQQGDYVRNLTADEFYELIFIESGNEEPTLPYRNFKETPEYYGSTLRFDGEELMLGFKKECINELSYGEFYKRTVNTFNL